MGGYFNTVNIEGDRMTKIRNMFIRWQHDSFLFVQLFQKDFISKYSEIFHEEFPSWRKYVNRIHGWDRYVLTPIEFLNNFFPNSIHAVRFRHAGQVWIAPHPHFIPKEVQSLFEGKGTLPQDEEFIQKLIIKLIGPSESTPLVHISDLFNMFELIFGNIGPERPFLSLIEEKHQSFEPDSYIKDGYWVRCPGTARSLLIEKLTMLFSDFAFSPLTEIERLYSGIFREDPQWKCLVDDPDQFQSLGDWMKHYVRTSTHSEFELVKCKTPTGSVVYYIKCPKELEKWIEDKEKQMETRNRTVDLERFLAEFEFLVPYNIRLPLDHLLNLHKHAFGSEKYINMEPDSFFNMVSGLKRWMKSLPPTHQYAERVGFFFDRSGHDFVNVVEDYPADKIPNVNELAPFGAEDKDLYRKTGEEDLTYAIKVKEEDMQMESNVGSKVVKILDTQDVLMKLIKTIDEKDSDTDSEDESEEEGEITDKLRTLQKIVRASEHEPWYGKRAPSPIEEDDEIPPETYDYSHIKTKKENDEFHVKRERSSDEDHYSRSDRRRASSISTRFSRDSSPPFSGFRGRGKKGKFAHINDYPSGPVKNSKSSQNKSDGVSNDLWNDSWDISETEEQSRLVSRNISPRHSRAVDPWGNDGWDNQELSAPLNKRDSSAQSPLHKRADSVSKSSWGNESGRFSSAASHHRESDRERSSFSNRYDLERSHERPQNRRSSGSLHSKGSVSSPRHSSRDSMAITSSSFQPKVQDLWGDDGWGSSVDNTSKSIDDARETRSERDIYDRRSDYVDIQDKGSFTPLDSGWGNADTFETTDWNGSSFQMPEAKTSTTQNETEVSRRSRSFQTSESISNHRRKSFVSEVDEFVNEERRKFLEKSRSSTDDAEIVQGNDTEGIHDKSKTARKKPSRRSKKSNEADFNITGANMVPVKKEFGAGIYRKNHEENIEEYQSTLKIHSSLDDLFSQYDNRLHSNNENNIPLQDVNPSRRTSSFSYQKQGQQSQSTVEDSLLGDELTLIAEIIHQSEIIHQFELTMLDPFSEDLFQGNILGFAFP